jgi:hypothetical protein
MRNDKNSHITKISHFKASAAERVLGLPLTK